MNEAIMIIGILLELLLAAGWPIFFFECYRHRWKHHLVLAILEAVISTIVVIWIGAIPMVDLAFGLAYHHGILAWPVSGLLILAAWGTPWIFMTVWFIHRSKRETS